MAKERSGNGSGTRKRRLGRGLSSLIQTPVEVSTTPAPPEEQATAPAPTSNGNATAPAVKPKQIPISEPKTNGSPEKASSGERLVDLEVGAIRTSRYQPRARIDEAALEQLAASIKSAGVMQPVLVLDRGDGFELVAGERRWRAAQLAGLTRIPAIIARLSEQEAAEWAVIENIQREDLGALERGRAFEQLVGRFGLTHEEVAQRVGLDRSTVTNFIRLTELEPETQELLESGKLTMGHCKALLKLATGEARVVFAQKAAMGGWSVRKTERMLASAVLRGNGKIDVSGYTRAERPASLTRLEEQLAAHLGTKVAVKTDGSFKKGKVVIEFFDLDQFDGLMERMGFSFEG